jgi:hypothetical protein
MDKGPETAHRAKYRWMGHNPGVPSGRCKNHVKLQGQAYGMLDEVKGSKDRWCPGMLPGELRRQPVSSVANCTGHDAHVTRFRRRMEIYIRKEG